MKYLKKIFEADTNFDPNIPENWTIYGLQSAIDALDEYNRLLSNDKIWKEHYNKFKTEYDLISDDEFEKWKKGDDLKSLEKNKLKLLNDIINFGENRLKEIKIERQEDIDLIKDLVINYLEDCESFSQQDLNVTGKFEEYVYTYIISLTFTKKCMKDRRDVDRNFQITENEVLDYWENIIQLFKVLKSYGFKSNIRYYQTNGVEMKIIVKRDEN
jgi:hypothetical protein